jgi:hypothetical protein
MNTEKTEKELRLLYCELRTQVERHVPSFATLTSDSASASDASTSPVSFQWLRFALGTIAIVLLLASITAAANRIRARALQRDMQQWAELSAWEARTDALLSISILPWGSSVRAASDSLLNTSPDSRGTTMEQL